MESKGLPATELHWSISDQKQKEATKNDQRHGWETSIMISYIAESAHPNEQQRRRRQTSWQVME